MADTRALFSLGQLYDRLGELIADPRVGRDAPVHVEGHFEDDARDLFVQAFIEAVDAEERCDPRSFALISIVSFDDHDERTHGTYVDPREEP